MCINYYNYNFLYQIMVFSILDIIFTKIVELEYILQINFTESKIKLKLLIC